MRNVKKKDNEQWIELCEYVKKEILLIEKLDYKHRF